jgi:membrane associated rhomboid family serine protease
MVFVNLPTRKRSHRPWAAALLAVLAILAYVWLMWAGNDPTKRAAILQWGTLSAGPAQWRLLWDDGRVFTLVTALFIHASLWHLLGNGVFLLIFGVPGERALGAWRLLALFLIGGALANLAASLLMGSPERIIVGASGGISALIGAYLVLFPRARLGIVVPLGLWLEFIRAPAALLIGLWAALQLIFTFVGPAFGAVAWWAHLTGFAVGVLMALMFKPGMSRRARGR